MSNNDSHNEFKNNVVTALKAYGDTIPRNNSDALAVMYNLTIDQLSSKEAAAYREGILSMKADIAGRPFKSYRHRNELRKILSD